MEKIRITEIFKIWLMSKLGIDSISFPADGRSSIEKIGLQYSLNRFADRYGGVSPIISFEMLKCLKQLWLYHPEFSQHIGNFVSLANTGHEISINAQSAQRAEIAANRLNETSARIYQHGAGVDGLINQELTSIGWSGAVSSEDVLNLTARRVEKVVIVPVEDIRFRYEDEQWKPYQQVGFGRGGNPDQNGMVPLHPETYRYLAVETIDNSPYAKPPSTAAVAMITEIDDEVTENLKYIVKKFSVFALMSVAVQRLRQKPNETPDEFEKRQDSFLTKVRDSLDGKFSRGLLVGYDNLKFNSESVVANGQGFEEVSKAIAQKMMSGLRQQPAFFGRTDSTTETYADVVYQLLLAQAHNYQRIVKRRRERTYMLDLRLGGIDVEGVSLKFNKAFSRSTKAEAEARKIETERRSMLAEKGILSPDEWAQEEGYEAAFDPSVLGGGQNIGDSAELGAAAPSFRFSFNKANQRYEFIRPVIRLSSMAGNEESAQNSNVVPIKKKALKALS